MSKFPNKNSSTEKRAKNVNEAVLAALEELGATTDEVNVEVVDEGKRGLFGIGAKDAVVRVTLKESVIESREKAAAAKNAEAKKPSETRNTKRGSYQKPNNVKKETAKKEQPAKKIDNSEVFKQPGVRHTASKAEKTEKAQKPAPKKIDNSNVFKQPEIRHAKKQEMPKPAEAPAPKPQKQEEPRIWMEAQGETAQAAEKFLSDIFKAMDIEVEISAKNDQDGNIMLTLSGGNMGIVIGKRGDTLDSLQYLTSLVVNQKSEDYIKVTIDTENYREKRSDALLALAKRLAEKVARTGKKFTLEPMNPYERRIIHSTLQDNDSVTTYSIGVEPYRKVVIAPKNPRPYRKPRGKAPRRNTKSRPPRQEQAPAAQKRGSYTTTYKANFKPQQHKAEYKNFEDYLAGHKDD